MNDAEAKKHIQHMVSFIQQEAVEKANEITVTAEEEFLIEKQRLIQQEKDKLEAEFTKKRKQIDVNRKIQASNALNQSRLAILQARQDAVAQIYAKAVQQLAKLGEGRKYRELQEKLVLQGLIKLMETNVLIHVREADVSLTQEILPGALRAFKEKTNITCQAVVATDRFLPPSPSEVKGAGPSCCGGCVVSANQGRIMCSNTLDSRLELAFENRLPEIRTMLFGVSTTRRWYD